MKTILVDVLNTFVTQTGIDWDIKELLDRFPNRKILVTNANEEEQAIYGMADLPYLLYTMNHHPEKTDPYYFECLLKAYNLKAENTLYIENNPDAIACAASIGITTYWFDKDKRDLDKLADFLQSSV